MDDLLRRILSVAGRSASAPSSLFEIGSLRAKTIIGLADVAAGANQRRWRVGCQFHVLSITKRDLSPCATGNDNTYARCSVAAARITP